MKKLCIYACVVLISFFAREASIYGQTDPQLSPAETQRIISAFTAKEAEFRHALNQYAFKRDALLQRIGMGGQVTGEYHRVSTFTFDDNGNRFEKINFFPMSSMGENITKEDIDDLGGISPFALDPSKVDKYNFKYIGKEKIDELNLYVFDVSPKVIPNPKKMEDRLFLGRIWVDDQDLQIVKTKGKGVPETKDNKFPIVETYREHIDGRYWFPTYSYADDELIFDSGDSLHLRMKVRYFDFAPARATLKVTEVGESDPAPSVISKGPAPSKGVAKPIEMGELNAKALTLPKAKYPEEARRLRASGKVRVQIVVDENGKVISAKATDGPLPLRAAAEEAARLATFAPTVQDGITVKVSGFLTYEFTP
ncbi:MAG TPA: TonB family protein [Pyrinomonadaceae bacterium]|nr:TonB family protein [Pyrinomonadaceae bacterium]